MQGQPVPSIVSAFLNNLRRPEYVHVLLNHLPLTGLLAALLGLIWSIITANRRAVHAGLFLVALFAVSIWPVAEFGEQAYDRVYSMADDRGDAYLKSHRELAERWTWIYYLTAAVAAGGSLAGRFWPKSLLPVACLAAALSVASLSAGAAIASLGAKVRHSEFRKGG